jgi:hypothetical protein
VVQCHTSYNLSVQALSVCGNAFVRTLVFSSPVCLISSCKDIGVFLCFVFISAGMLFEFTQHLAGMDTVWDHYIDTPQREQ